MHRNQKCTPIRDTVLEIIVILKTPVWKFMKRYCCVFLYMFSLFKAHGKIKCE